LPRAHEIPEFASEAQEREWWASHETSDLPGHEVPLRLAPAAERATRVVSVRTDQSTLERLKRLAADRGLDYHEMVRAWIDERRQQEAVSQ
jgi:predicted DNA binding CopG/RHH family protein